MIASCVRRCIPNRYFHVSAFLPLEELLVAGFRNSECKRNSTGVAPQGMHHKEHDMGGDLTGLVAIIMVFSFPVALMALYMFYRVNKLRSEERMAALARGVSVPMEPELSQAARSRRAGILLTAAAIGYMLTFALIARVEPDAWMAASFGIVPLAIGLGFFLDATLVRRDLRSS
jgi:hypothetical protein